MAISPITNLVVSGLGDEKVTYGNFTESLGWTFGQAGENGWDYDGTNDEADCDGDQSAAVDLERSISAVASELYLLSYKIKNWVAGTVIPQIGGVNGTARGGSGTWENYITATGTGNLKFRALGGGSFIENGTFDTDDDPPDDWTAVTALLTGEGSGQAGGNCMKVASDGGVFLLASEYTDCVAGDVGKQVQDDGDEIGVLIAYDNTRRRWLIDSDDTIADASAMTITDGTGVGTAARATTGLLSGANSGKAYQDITTTVGIEYAFTGYFKKGTSDTGRFLIGTTSDEDSLYDSGALSDVAWAEKTTTFTATNTTTRITCQTDDETVDETSFFDEIAIAYSGFNGSIDDVSVKKILYPGSENLYMTWTNGQAYDSIRVIRDGQPYDNIAGNATSYTDTEVTVNTLYSYQMQGRITGEFVEPSDSDSGAYWRDILTDEIAVSESVTDYATVVDVEDTITDTMYVSDFVIDAKDIITDYVYYLGTATGEIYEYGGFYKSDAGTAIEARWESKDTDFADQSIEISDRFKTVEFVRLHYIDKSAGARISIKVSTDGGASWTTKTKSIGTGNSKGKIKDFYFVKMGQIFRFAIESISAVDEFQWVGLEVFYNSGGDFFEV